MLISVWAFVQLCPLCGLHLSIGVREAVAHGDDECGLEGRKDSRCGVAAARYLPAGSLHVICELTVNLRVVKIITKEFKGKFWWAGVVLLIVVWN